MNEHGFLPEQWSAAKAEVKVLLAVRAKVSDTMSYSQLVILLKSVRLEPHDQRLFHLLDEVSTEEDAAGRGMLSAIVVHKSGDKQPGSGFFELAKKLGRDTSDITCCWIKELRKVYAQWSGK